MVGDDAAELTVEAGMEIGMAMGNLEPLLLVMGELAAWWDSRRLCTEGETARRLLG